MKTPSTFVRMAGTPILAILLFIGYGAIITGWFNGQVSGWLAAFACLAALKTLKALGDVKRYKAWLANWNAMDGQEQPQAKPARTLFSAGRVLVLVAVAMFLFPLLQPVGATNSALKDFAWVISGLYLLFALGRFIAKRISKGREAPADGENAPVSCLIGQPSSSPSREDATAGLPDYCADLLKR